MSRFGALVEISHAMVAQQNKRTFTPTGKQPGESRTIGATTGAAMGAAQVIAQKAKEVLFPESHGTWFTAGPFADGYQFGDVSKAFRGTVRDAGEQFLAGGLSFGEKTIDTGAYLVGGLGDILGSDTAQEDAGSFIKQDLYDELSVSRKILNGLSALQNPAATVQKYIFNKALGLDKTVSAGSDSKDSLLGEKMHNMARSVGETSTIALLEQATRIPWQALTAVSSFGGEVENELRQGATYEEAGLGALISAAADVLSESLFDGNVFKGKMLSDGLINKLADNISGAFLKRWVPRVLNEFGEGLEEIFARDLTVFGRWLFNLEDDNLVELLFSPKALEEQADAFISGTIASHLLSPARRQPSAGIYGDSQNESLLVSQEDSANKAIPTTVTVGNEIMTAEADKAFFDTVRRYLPDGGETLQPVSKAGTEQQAIDSRGEAVELDMFGWKEYPIPERISPTGKQRKYVVICEASIGKPASRATERRRGNKMLYELLKSDPQYRKDIEQVFGYDLLDVLEKRKPSFRNPSPDWVWHHPEDRLDIIELMPYRQHIDPVRRPYVHPNRKGGYALNHARIEKETEESR